MNPPTSPPDHQEVPMEDDSLFSSSPSELLNDASSRKRKAEDDTALPSTKEPKRPAAEGAFVQKVDVRLDTGSVESDTSLTVDKTTIDKVITATATAAAAAAAVDVVVKSEMVEVRDASNVEDRVDSTTVPVAVVVAVVVPPSDFTTASTDPDASGSNPLETKCQPTTAPIETTTGAGSTEATTFKAGNDTSTPNAVGIDANETSIASPNSLLPFQPTPLVSPHSSNRHGSKASYDLLKWATVTNDGSPDSMVKLIGLKSLFAKQLPKMPRAYIARLVLDRRHTSLAILSDNPAVQGSDEEIIGGICYRAFADMRFAEIAFCAVNATHQVKGYGTKLMNLLKQTAARTGIEFFITYADNYAIGYFKKQGFTKQITMPKGRYYGLIKDYDGGTPMECYVHPSIDYCNVPALVQAQRNFILARVAHATGHSLTVYPPLPTLAGNMAPSNTTATLADTATTSTTTIGTTSTTGTVSRGQWAAAQALSVPGVAEAGWTLVDLIQASTAKGGSSLNDDIGAGRQKSGALKQELLSLVRKLEEQQFAWPFREPVDPLEVPDYFDVITNPIDLKTMTARIRHDTYYRNKQMLYADVLLMVENCKLYNEDGSTYIQCAVALEKYSRTLFHDVAMTAVPAGNNTTALVVPS